MALKFPDRPATTLPELQRDVLDLVYQLRDGATALLITNVQVGTAVTRIAHGQVGIPRAVLVCPHGAIAAGRATTDPDSTFIYVIAASACTADLVVFL